MSSDLSTIEESIKIALDAADAATDVTSEYNKVKPSHQSAASNRPPRDNLVLPFLIYNLEGAERDEFTNDMPWILKKFIVPIVWKSKWEKMRPFLLV